VTHASQLAVPQAAQTTSPASSQPPQAAAPTSPTSTQPLVVPLVAGTPRYLLMRNVVGEELRAPKVLQSCSIAFQVGVVWCGVKGVGEVTNVTESHTVRDMRV
jgi:hypothetical protein